MLKETIYVAKGMLYIFGILFAFIFVCASILLVIVQQRDFSFQLHGHPFETIEIDFKSGYPNLGGPVFDPESEFGFFEKLGYRLALSKFPDAQSCIVTDEQNTPKMNWPDIRSAKQLEVCLFNVASAQNNRENALAWFQTAGMYASVYDVLYKRDAYFETDTLRRYLVIRAPEMAEAHPNIFFIDRVLPPRRNVYLDFDIDGRVKYIQQFVSML